MIGYVYTKHPITGDTIVVLPTGKTQEDTAEFRVLTAGSNLEVLWLKREQIFSKEHVIPNTPLTNKDSVVG